jgi:hypothetical protein
MEKFQKFYKGDFDTENDYGSFGRLFEALEKENSLSRLFWFDLMGDGAGISVYNIKNDNGFIELGYHRKDLLGKLIKIDREEFFELKKKLAESYAFYINIFTKLLGKGSVYSCYENDDSYLIFFTEERLLLEGTKYEYNFDFGDNKNYKDYYFKVIEEDHYLSDILKSIEERGFQKITKDPVLIYCVWQKYIPDMWNIEI